MRKCLCFFRETSQPTLERNKNQNAKFQFFEVNDIFEISKQLFTDSLIAELFVYLPDCVTLTFIETQCCYTYLAHIVDNAYIKHGLFKIFYLYFYI